MEGIRQKTMECSAGANDQFIFSSEWKKYVQRRIRNLRRRLDRREDGYYLCVADGREIEVDGRRVNEDLLLQEGNRFRIRELSGVFHERAGARH